MKDYFHRWPRESGRETQKGGSETWRPPTLRTMTVIGGFVFNQRDLFGAECYISVNKMLLPGIDNIHHIALAVGESASCS